MTRCSLRIVVAPCLVLWLAASSTAAAWQLSPQPLVRRTSTTTTPPEPLLRTVVVAQTTDQWSFVPSPPPAAAAAALVTAAWPLVSRAAEEAAEGYEYGAVDAPIGIAVGAGILAILTAALPVLLRGGEEAFEEIRERDADTFGARNNKDVLNKKRK